MKSASVEGGIGIENVIAIGIVNGKIQKNIYRNKIITVCISSRRERSRSREKSRRRSKSRDKDRERSSKTGSSSSSSSRSDKKKSHRKEDEE